MNWKNSWELIEEYLWIVGLALIGTGIGFIFQDGKQLLISGIAIAAIGVFLNAKRNIPQKEKIKSKSKNNNLLLEIKRTYLMQIENFETKVYLSWTGIIFSLFIAWIYGKVNGWYPLGGALTLIVLDTILEKWRKKQYNNLITEIKEDKLDNLL